jgi:hypothetical protein
VQQAWATTEDGDDFFGEIHQVQYPDGSVFSYVQQCQSQSAKDNDRPDERMLDPKVLKTPQHFDTAATLMVTETTETTGVLHEETETEQSYHR